MKNSKVRKTMRVALLTMMAFALMFNPAFAAKETDEKGSSDHSLFTRMPDTFIETYKVEEFNQVKFRMKDGTAQPIEGKVTKISYKTKKSAPKPSALEIVRNHTGAIVKAGGEVIFEDNRDATMKLAKDGSEIWAKVSAAGGQYTLTIVEPKKMTQSVTSDVIFDALSKDGFMVIDVHFEFGKATIMPESEPLILQIVTMLKKKPELKVSVEGHTDNVGDKNANKTLSEARASAVKTAVVAGGIDEKRMKAVGWGETKPVADNRSDEGRAKNRRVELVKM